MIKIEDKKMKNEERQDKSKWRLLFRPTALALRQNMGQLIPMPLIFFMILLM